MNRLYLLTIFAVYPLCCLASGYGLGLSLPEHGAFYGLGAVSAVFVVLILVVCAVIWIGAAAAFVNSASRGRLVAVDALGLLLLLTFYAGWAILLLVRHHPESPTHSWSDRLFEPFPYSPMELDPPTFLPAIFAMLASALGHMMGAVRLAIVNVLWVLACTAAMCSPVALWFPLDKGKESLRTVLLRSVAMVVLFTAARICYWIATLFQGV